MERPSALFNADNFMNVIPMDDMSLAEKLNSVARLSIYMGLIIFILSGDQSYLFIPVVVMAVTIFIYKNKQEQVEQFFAEYDNKVYTFPTVNNPFMNFDNIADPKDKPPAIDSYNQPEVQELIEDKFNERLYRDAGDLYHKANNQRQFYTMPNTTGLPDTVALAKWLYSTDATCKEDGIKCAPYYDPQEAV